ncbi:MAG TPA: metallophosphoesterase [Candidatus Acidoferrales bacterium]|nr:metallophosphoesterase [Candidatus Acidoferrales bacterium]
MQRKPLSVQHKYNSTGKTMLIGAISDSHDNISLIKKAVATLNNKNVGLVLHAGDYCSPFTITHFKQLNSNFIGVFGNNDGDHQLLTKRFQETTNCVIRDHFTQITIEGYRIALLHGDVTELLYTLIDTGYFDAIIHGHSHNKSIQHKGKTLVINPGELCGYLTGKATFALLDTKKNEATIVEL